MAYVQGTQVRLEADFTDPEPPHAGLVPDDVRLTIAPPTAPAYVLTRSADEVQADPDRPGRYYYLLDTSPEPGTWRYQFESTGSTAVAARKELTVSKRLAVA